MKKLFFATTSVFIFLLYLFSPARAGAAGLFNITVDRIYEVDSAGVMQVTETRTVKNNTSDLYIPKHLPGNSSFETFRVLKFRIGPEVDNVLLDKSAETVKVTDVAGNPLSYDRVSENDSYAFKVKYPKNLNPGETQTFVLKYTNYELSEKIGGLYDIYIHGFEENFKFENGNTVVKYNTSLLIPKSFPEENLVNPSPASQAEQNGKRLFTFSQESLVGKFVWVQLGKKQAYKFKIVQRINPSEERKTGFNNEYRIVIPKDIDEAKITQKVYFSSITPSPSYVRKDNEGNMIAGFEVESNARMDVVLEGYAEVELTGLDLDASQVTSTSEIPAGFESYLRPAEFWEVDDPAIASKAAEIKGEETNIFKIVEKTYKFVVDSIDYSQVKRFGLNERQGAKKTLEGGAAVCMEYSDLFLSLARAQNVPTRAAFGYGYDSRVPSDKQESHQWVEVFMPGLNKWVSVDVTWGESGTALIGGDLNHFYIYNAGEDPNTPAMVESLVHGKAHELNPPDFEISVADSVPEGRYLTSEELLTRYPYKERGFDPMDVLVKLYYFFRGSIEDLGVANILIALGFFVGGGVLMVGGSMIAKGLSKKKEEVTVPDSI